MNPATWVYRAAAGVVIGAGWYAHVKLTPTT